VLLKTLDGNKFLPIWIGHPEAAAILVKLQGSPTPRPMTHDLVADMLVEMNAQVTKIAVTELRESTFYAVITLQVNGSEIDVDSRPSDALALAVRTSAPIFVADQVIDDSAIEFGSEAEDEQVVRERPRCGRALELHQDRRCFRMADPDRQVPVPLRRLEEHDRLLADEVERDPVDRHLDHLFLDYPGPGGKRGGRYHAARAGD